jgi:hypothetical protein
MIPIFIPTKGRVYKQVTLDSIGKENAFVVCPKHEVQQHELMGRKVIDRGEVTGINNVRQFILEYAMEAQYDKILILDDDLIFNTRASADAPNLRKVTSEETAELFNRMDKLLDEYVHVGVSPRQMNDKHFPDTVKYGMRQNAVHAIRPEIIHGLGIRYDAMELMEDYYVTLELFKRGHGNAVIVDWTWDQRGASGAAGGCSSYRNAELQERASLALAEKFPDYVKAVQKETKTGWDGMKTRWDVRVQWRKAAKDGNCI